MSHFYRKYGVCHFSTFPGQPCAAVLEGQTSAFEVRVSTICRLYYELSRAIIALSRHWHGDSGSSLQWPTQTLILEVKLARLSLWHKQARSKSGFRPYVGYIMNCLLQSSLCRGAHMETLDHHYSDPHKPSSSRSALRGWVYDTNKHVRSPGFDHMSAILWTV